jgi:hypothetical protein
LDVEEALVEDMIAAMMCYPDPAFKVGENFVLACTSPTPSLPPTTTTYHH